MKLLQCAILASAMATVHPASNFFDDLIKELDPGTTTEAPAKKEMVDAVEFQLVGDVDDDMATSLATAFSQPAKEYHVRIDTPGGAMDSARRISDTLETAAKTAKVICTVDGWAASAGFYILESCAERRMTTRSLLMAHEPWLPASGGITRDRAKNIQGELDAVAYTYAAQCASRMKMSTEAFLSRIKGREWWLTAGEAKQWGAVDSVAENPNAGLGPQKG